MNVTPHPRSLVFPIILMAEPPLARNGLDVNVPLASKPTTKIDSMADRTGGR